MTIQSFEKFIDNLAKLLREPPYLIFLFIGATLVFVSILSNRYFEQVWLFFLYSIIGTIWRYIERDIYKCVLKTEWQRIVVIFIYHLGNIVLFSFLLKYLEIF